MLEQHCAFGPFTERAGRQKQFQSAQEFKPVHRTNFLLDILNRVDIRLLHWGLYNLYIATKPLFPYKSPLMLSHGCRNGLRLAGFYSAPTLINRCAGSSFCPPPRFTIIAFTYLGALQCSWHPSVSSIYRAELSGRHNERVEPVEAPYGEKNYAHACIVSLKLP